jgi:hypothetical protein
MSFLGFSGMDQLVMEHHVDLLRGRVEKTVSSSISGVVGTLGYKAIASRALWYLYFLTCFLFLYWPVNVTLLFVGIIVRRNRLGR